MTLRNADRTGRISRRAALSLLTAAPAAAMTWTPAEAAQAHEHAAQASAAAPATYRRKFFTAHEFATVGVLADLVIPRDERSGSATDAGVPAFMDFMMIDQPRRQVAMRGGLALLDRLSQDRCGRRFVTASDRERRALLDEIAYTSNADPALAHAVVFFGSFRDLTATGFFTSKMGIADLQYQGNVFVNEWTGCPEPALKKLGVTYDA